MKNLTLEEYEAQARKIAFNIMASGDTVRVDCGEAGAFIIMEEQEYNIMRESLINAIEASDIE